MATFYLVVSPEECALKEVDERLAKAVLIRLVGEATSIDTIAREDLERLWPEVEDTLGGGFVDEFLDEDTILLATTGKE